MHKAVKNDKLQDNRKSKMKKIFLLSFILIPFVTASHAALNWWEQPTICRINPSKCYSNMGAGYNTEEWDQDSDCRGKKIICGTALSPQSDDNWALSKRDIRNMSGISSDFNIDILNGDCFGVRRTISNGLQAMYNNNPVDVYCPGILEQIYNDDDIEAVETGLILTRSAQPTCKTLADIEYVRVKNGRCYGKRYSESDYYIDCSRGDNDVRLIILNGANYTEPMGGNPINQAEADDIFQEMVSMARELRE